MRRICWLEQEKPTSLLSYFIKYKYSTNANTGWIGEYRVNGSRKAGMGGMTDWMTEEMTTSLVSCYMKYKYKKKYGTNTNTYTGWMVQEKSTSLLSFCISLNSSRVCLQKVSKSHKKLVQDHLSEKAASLATDKQKPAMPKWKHFFFLNDETVFPIFDLNEKHCQFRVCDWTWGGSIGECEPQILRNACSSHFRNSA